MNHKFSSENKVSPTTMIFLRAGEVSVEEENFSLNGVSKLIHST